MKRTTLEIEKNLDQAREEKRREGTKRRANNYLNTWIFANDPDQKIKNTNMIYYLDKDGKKEFDITHTKNKKTRWIDTDNGPQKVCKRRQHLKNKNPKYFYDDSIGEEVNRSLTSQIYYIDKTGEKNYNRRPVNPNTPLFIREGENVRKVISLSAKYHRECKQLPKKKASQIKIHKKRQEENSQSILETKQNSNLNKEELLAPDDEKHPHLEFPHLKKIRFVSIANKQPVKYWFNPQTGKYEDVHQLKERAQKEKLQNQRQTQTSSYSSPKLSSHTAVFFNQSSSFENSEQDQLSGDVDENQDYSSNTPGKSTSPKY